MGSNFTVYNLGQLGVNVDVNPIHLQDGELTSAQNAVKDDLGIQGALTKRLGLVQFNTSAGAGSISGGIGVPLPFTRNIYLGAYSLGATTWLVSTTGFTTTVSAPTTPSQALSGSKLSNIVNAISSLNLGYGRYGVNYNNNILYAETNYTQGTNPPPIFIFDGAFGHLLTYVPTNPDIGTVPQSIIWMIVNDNKLYYSVHDTGTVQGGAPNFQGSVYQLDLQTGITKKLGATFPTGYLPYNLFWYNDKLWCGTISQAGKSQAGKIYYMRPSVDLVWTLDQTFSTDIFPLTMGSLNGELFVGTYAATGLSAIVSKRNSSGTWSTVDTAAGTSPTGENWYGGIISFSNSLYMGYNESLVRSYIRKYDGTSFTTAFDAASTSVNYLNSFTDNGVLFFYGPNAINTKAFISSSNGSSWTDRVTSLNSNRASSAVGVIVS